MLTRFGISLDEELLQRFDALIEEKGYSNRSEAIRDLIRDALVQREWEKEAGERVGTITLIYDHHLRELPERLTELQHRYTGQIISTMHVHLDHDNCLEVLAVRGEAQVVRNIADQLIGTKGVKHGKLVTTTTGRELK
ncbi:MAG: nickel-responsive transcriptional regulator NikR [candidate division KSB1 bacterium]|nr:nickel-responsive transcriptional regulator NikR [candidate division KSB1 bacterium]MDZ7295695.1 nickel-responsive transcriptional regulator NikR [candidate division KSB1 bacterium]MDZ7337098.1 nickel-responsive transcriptional regulator NikR [candidate division KSB1 bacterium]